MMRMFKTYVAHKCVETVQSSNVLLQLYLKMQIIQYIFHKYVGLLSICLAICCMELMHSFFCCITSWKNET